MVTMKFKTTDPTPMDPDIQRLLFSGTTTRAILTRVGRVDLDDGSTSFFRFVDREDPDQTPGSVRNAFRQAMVLDHALDVEFLKHDNATAVHESSTDSVSEIQSTVSDALVDLGYGFSSEGSGRSSFRLPRELPLSSFEVMFIGSQKPGVPNHLTLVRGQEVFEARVQANGGGRGFEYLGFHGSDETHEPLARRGPRDGRGLDGTDHRSVEVELEVTDALNPQDRTLQNRSPGVLGPAQTIVPKAVPEPREPRVRGLGFGPLEETLESPVYPELRVLKDLTVDFPEFRFLLFPAGQESVGIEQPESGLVLFPRGFPDLQGLVVGPTTEIEPMTQLCPLNLGAVETIAESFNHGTVDPNYVKKYLS
jgi:hypothetical protein